MKAERHPDGDRAGGTVGWLDRWGVPGSFVWGLAEATLFFIVPDVIVGGTALLVPRKATWAAIAAVAGAVVGGFALILWASASEASARAAIDAVPAVPARMFDEARAALADRGGLAMVTSAFTGVPYKVWALEMTILGWSVPSVLAWTIPARAVRLGGIAAVGAVVGQWAGARRSFPPRSILGAWFALWVVVYAVYWSRTGF